MSSVIPRMSAAAGYQTSPFNSTSTRSRSATSSSSSQSRPKPVLLWFDRQKRKQIKEAMREGNTTTNEAPKSGRMTCLCSPSTHPGSFGCRYHKSISSSTTTSTTIEAPKSGRMTCLCSPSTHPGSFRCRYHKSISTTTSLAPERPEPSLSSSWQYGGLLATKPRFDSAPNSHCGNRKQRQLSRFGRAALAAASATTRPGPGTTTTA